MIAMSDPRSDAEVGRRLAVERYRGGDRQALRDLPEIEHVRTAVESLEDEIALPRRSVHRLVPRFED